MKYTDKYKKNISSINERFNNNIKILIDEYTPRKQHTMFYCKKHNHTFKSSIHILLNNVNTCGCPLCKLEKLSLSGKKGMSSRWGSIKEDL